MLVIISLFVIKSFIIVQNSVILVMNFVNLVILFKCFFTHFFLILTLFFLYLRQICQFVSEEFFRNFSLTYTYILQKQPSIGVLIKSALKICCSHAEKCDFNSNFALHHTLGWVFSCKFGAYFHKTSSWEHLWRAASYIVSSHKEKSFCCLELRYISDVVISKTVS